MGEIIYHPFKNACGYSTFSYDGLFTKNTKLKDSQELET